MKKTAFHPTLTIALNHVEGVLIHASEPPLNSQAGRFGETVVRYLQCRDPRLGPTDRQMLEAIMKEDAIGISKIRKPRTGR